MSSLVKNLILLIFLAIAVSVGFNGKDDKKHQAVRRSK